MKKKIFLSLMIITFAYFVFFGRAIAIDCNKLSHENCNKNNSECKWNGHKNVCQGKYNSIAETPNTTEENNDTSNNVSNNIEYNNYTSSTTSCGNKLIENIPKGIPKIISIFYIIILQVALPVVLVILGMIDLFKGVVASDEKKISEGRTIFIKRLIAAAIIFFVFTIVKLTVSLLADEADDKKFRIIQCTECFIKNECDNNKTKKCVKYKEVCTKYKKFDGVGPKQCLETKKECVKYETK